MLSRRLATTGGLASSGDASGDRDVDGASVRAWRVHCDAHLELAAVSNPVYEPGQLLHAGLDCPQLLPGCYDRSAVK